MMSIIPKAADTVLLPVWTPKHENARMTIEWKQTFTKTGDYYCIVAKDTSQEGMNPFNSIFTHLEIY